jgi:hypothetical protein
LLLLSVGGNWRLAYDCSKLLVGDCVGQDTSGNCISRKGFKSTFELRRAVGDYLADNSTDSVVALTYGWPIDNWDVSKIQDFSNLFATKNHNRAATYFNEDISGWDTSSATTMQSMILGAKSFDRPTGNWDVSSVTDMHSMFDRASSFNQSLAEWNVSRVWNMRSMFSSAKAFNQPIGNFMRQRFFVAASFNQSYADWDVSRVTDMYAMCASSGLPGAGKQQSCFHV